MISTTEGSQALSIISAPDAKSVEVSVQKFMGVFPHQKIEDVPPPGSIESIDRMRFQIRLREANSKSRCSPEQQARATIDIMKHHEWQAIIKALGTSDKGVTPRTISGRAAMDAERLNDLRRILGREDTTDWDGRFDMDKILRSAQVDSLAGTGMPYARESHKETWYQATTGAPRLVQHPIFDDDQLKDLSVHLYPVVLQVNKVSVPHTPEGHGPSDQGIEFWYVLEGQLGMEWEDPDVPGSRGSGVLADQGSALLYDTGLRHVPFVPEGQTGPSRCLHVYFTRGVGAASYRPRR